MTFGVWTIKLRPGIYFQDDPAFKGQKRELTANDYVYSFKRYLRSALEVAELPSAIGGRNQRHGGAARQRVEVEKAVRL